MQPQRQPRTLDPVTLAALGVALLALLVAVGSTAYAAGLAKNSVGTKQLKNKAVSTAKIKNKAISSAKIKPDAVTGKQVKTGSLTASDLALGVLPSRGVVVSRDLEGGSGDLTIYRGQGWNMLLECSSLGDYVKIGLVPAGGTGGIDVVGELTRQNSGGSDTPSTPRFQEDVVTVESLVASTGGTSRGHLSYLVRAGDGPWSTVEGAVLVYDSGPTTSCKARVLVAPVG